MRTSFLHLSPRKSDLQAEPTLGEVPSAVTNLTINLGINAWFPRSVILYARKTSENSAWPICHLRGPQLLLALPGEGGGWG